MKKIWAFLKKHKDGVGLLMHAAWIIANIKYPDLAGKEEYIAGHGVIGGLTGKGIWDRTKRNLPTINKNISKATNAVKKKMHIK